MAYVTRVFAPYRSQFFAGLGARGWDLRVLIAGGPNPAAEYPAAAGFEVEDIRRSSLPRWRGDLLRSLEKFKPDAVILEHGARLDFTWTALISCFRSGPPTIIWTHGTERAQKYSGRSSLGSAGRSLQLHLADGIVCYDRTSAERLAGSYRTKVIGCAANSTDGAAFFQPANANGIHSRIERRFAAGLRTRTAIVGLGRQVPEKKFTELPRVVRGLRNLGLDIGLLLVGDGPERPKIEVEAQKHGLVDESAVVLAGAVTERADLAQWLSLADVSVSTGSIGLSAVDSLFAGLPMFAYAPGPDGPYHGPEWIHVRHGVTGWVAPTSDEDALIRMLRAYLTEPEEVRLQAEGACREYAKHNLGIEQMVVGMERVLTSVISRRQQSR